MTQHVRMHSLCDSSALGQTWQQPPQIRRRQCGAAALRLQRAEQRLIIGIAEFASPIDPLGQLGDAIIIEKDNARLRTLAIVN